MKPPNLTFYGGHGHTTTNFPLPLLNLNKILKNSTPGKVAFIWHIEQVQIDAIKFERTQIYFCFTDVFSAVGLIASSRVACLFICPCFSNGFVLGAGAFSSNVIGELLAVSVKSLVTPSISVFRSPNVCFPLPWSTQSPLFWLYCGLFGIGLECPLSFAPLDHLWWLHCGFLGPCCCRLCWLHCCFLRKV